MNGIRPSINNGNNSGQANISNLDTLCILELFKLNKNFEPSNPRFHEAFGEDSANNNARKVIIEIYKDKPAIVRATLPFYKKACHEYTNLIVDALMDVLIHGNDKDCEEAFLSLLWSYQRNVIPESTKHETQTLFLPYLGRMLSDEKENLLHLSKVCDSNQLIAHALKKLLIKKTELVEKQINVRRLCEEFFQDDDAELQNRICNNYDKKQEQILIICEQIQQIYSYLKYSVDSIDEHLLDDAVALCMENKIQTANNICQILIDSTESAPHLEAQFLQKILLTDSKSITDKFANYLVNTVNNQRPKTAYFLGKMYLEDGQNAIKQNQEKAVKYLSIAAVQKYKPAIDELNRLAKNCNAIEIIAPLSEQDHLTGLDDKKWVKEAEQIAEKIVREMKFWKEAWPIWREQNSKFCIHIESSFESRIRTGQSCLGGNQRGFGYRNGYMRNEALQGAEMLATLSKLDHPLAMEAKQILNKWLSDTNNKIWLVNQYAIEASNFNCDCQGYQRYKKLVTEHVDIFLNQVQELKTQNNTDAANKLIYELIDAAIDLEGNAGWNKDESFVSYFYELLISSNVLDEDCLKEVAARKKLCDFKQASILKLTNLEKLKLEEEELVCFINAAETKGRRSPAYQLGMWYCDGRFGIEKNLNEAIYYFQKAAKEGCNDSKAQLDRLVEHQASDETEKLMKKLSYLITSSKKEDAADQFKLGLILDKEDPEQAQLLFRQAAKNGNEQAKNFLKVNSTKQENCNIQ